MPVAIGGTLVKAVTVLGWFVSAAVVGTLLVWMPIPALAPGQEYDWPTYSVEMAGEWILLKRGTERDIYVKPQSIQYCEIWPDHPNYGPTVICGVGAKEFHIDCYNGEHDEIATFFVQTLTGQ